MFLPLLPLFGVLATAADLSNAGTTQAYEPGIYVLKSMEGPGKGKHLAYQSSNREALRDVAQSSGILSTLGGTGAGVAAASSFATVGAAAVVAGVAVGATVSCGGAAAAVVVAIPILKMLRSDTMILSSTRKLL